MMSPRPPRSHESGITRLEGVQPLVGNTPHLSLTFPECPRATFRVKLEGQNPTGSVKDRAALCMMKDAVTASVLEAGLTILDASSGNMGCSLAYFGTLLGLPTTVVVSSKLTKEKRTFLEHFGASIVVIGDSTIEGNAHCRELQAAPGGDRYLFLDQLHNWNNPRAHSESTGPEILREHPNCRVLVGSLGSGGTLLGTARFLKAHIPDLLVVATESAAGTRMPGVGAFVDGDYITPFIRAGFKEGSFDIRHRVSLSEAAEELLRARAQGIFGGSQTGAVLRAACAVACERGIEGDVVVITGDSGWKNMESLTNLRDLVKARADAPA